MPQCLRKRAKNIGETRRRTGSIKRAREKSNRLTEPPTRKRRSRRGLSERKMYPVGFYVKNLRRNEQRADLTEIHDDDPMDDRDDVREADWLRLLIVINLLGLSTERARLLV